MVRVHTPALCMIKGLGLINDEQDPVFTGTFGIIIFYRYSSPRITAVRSPRSSGVSQILWRSGPGGFSSNVTICVVTCRSEIRSDAEPFVSSVQVLMASRLTILQKIAVF